MQQDRYRPLCIHCGARKRVLPTQRHMFKQPNRRYPRLGFTKAKRWFETSTLAAVSRLPIRGWLLEVPIYRIAHIVGEAGNRCRRLENLLIGCQGRNRPTKGVSIRANHSSRGASFQFRQLIRYVFTPDSGLPRSSCVSKPVGQIFTSEFANREV